MTLECKLVGSITHIPASDWDALVQDAHPLLSHAFLSALEQFGCISKETGWMPHYLGVYEGKQLVGTMPLFQKLNSWGEFVFDHAWADAYHRYGLEYYPKLVAAIPFSPVLGQRLLAQKGREKPIYDALISAVMAELKGIPASSFHCLFPRDDELEALAKKQMMIRHDCQYHWHNHHYENFDAFLHTLSARKRKSIRRERRKVNEAGVTFRVLSGIQATSLDWQHFAHFYQLTYQRKWGQAIFSEDFFIHIAQTLGEQMVLVLADRDQQCIAGALMYRSNTMLYGRHWGCAEFVDGLHFEACYYQGIEICIQHGLTTFEPGAQGAHKLARGFEPTLTRSAHWVADERFRPAIMQFVKDEQAAVDEHIVGAGQHSAYKKAD